MLALAEMLAVLLACSLVLLGGNLAEAAAEKSQPRQLDALPLPHILEAHRRMGRSGLALEKAAKRQAPAAQILVDLETPISSVDPQFLSVTIDAGDIRKNWSGINFTAPRIINMCRALSPAMLRVGGTDGDFVIFNATVNPPETNFTLTPSEWDEVNQFVQAVGWDFVFGLNARLRSPFPNGVWDPKNAMSLMSYSNSKKYTVQWELGNEPDLWKPSPVPPQDHAKDFVALSEVVKMEKTLGTMIVGPDVASSTAYFAEFLENVPQGILNATTYHQYYGNGKTGTLPQFYDVDLLDDYIHTAIYYQSATALLHPEADVWLGETSSLYDGGTPHLSDSFVAGFMWLDKLGIAAVVGHKRVFRQTLVGGNYALLDSNQNPLPDYWLSVLYKKLVGTKVLYVDGSLEKGRYLRVYAHCAKPPYSAGSVVLLLLNMDFAPNEAILLNPELMSSDRDEYWLTPLAGNITSTTVLLNADILQLVNNEQLPDFKPLPRAASSIVILPTLSFGFIVFKNVTDTACL